MEGCSTTKAAVSQTTTTAYVVSFSTWRRVPIFADASLACRACRAMTDGRLWYRSKLLAWVLMPDRWFGLVEPGGFEDLSLLVNGLKVNSTRWLRTEFPETGRFWSRDFHEHAVHRNASLPATAGHLVRQVLRAGLAEDLGHYPYWDSRWLEFAQPPALRPSESARGASIAQEGGEEAINRTTACATPHGPAPRASGCSVRR